MVRLGSQQYTGAFQTPWGKIAPSQLNEMPGVQQSLSSSTRLLLLNSLLDLFCYIIS